MTTKARIENGVVVEILTADPFPPFHESLVWVECGTDVKVGWEYVGGSFQQPEPPPVEIPSMTPRQIRLVLNAHGLRSAVEAAVASVDQNTKDMWEFSSVFLRTDHILVTMAHGLGLTDAQLDALFIEGAAL